MLPLSALLAISAASASACPARPATLAAAPRNVTCVAPAAVYDGRRGQLDVDVPRLEGPDAVSQVDGVLSEPAWTKAALLTGFSAYSPRDGVPASDSTQVLVWYSPTAIHFGVRAFAPPGSVNATVPRRDHLDGEDFVEFIIGTFDDAQHAMLFAVNPLGIQGDGTVSETISTTGTSLGDGASDRTPAVFDLNPDYVYSSRGRLTDYGYEVEVEVPFRSLRYQSASTQRWAFNAIRFNRRRDERESWFPVRRDAASFIAQHGYLEGLHDLRRGLVIDATPTVTQSVSGAPSDHPDARWRYSAGRPQLGADVRWGVTENISADATIHPDFSQVEADELRLQTDPRQAIRVDEKRPFFLDGAEQFAVPGNVIYTRRIVQPDVALKVAGKAAGIDVAALTALDRSLADDYGPSGRTLFDIVRVQRDLGGGSRAGAVLTDRESAGAWNRLGGADARFVFGGVYNATLQAVESATKDSTSGVRRGPLWQAELTRSGRRFGLDYAITGSHPDFLPGAGFVSRPNVVRGEVTHSLTFYNAPHALVRRWTGKVMGIGLWKYDQFTTRRPALEQKLNFDLSGQIAGGWGAEAAYLLQRYRGDSDQYRDYYMVSRGAGVLDTIPYGSGVARTALPNRDWLVTVNTPSFRLWSARALVVWGQDDNFDEWSSARYLGGDASVTLHPTTRLGFEGSLDGNRIKRADDGSRVSQTWLPQAKAEYHVSRAAFVRLVARESFTQRDSLRDDGRTNAPIVLRTPSGFVRAAATRSNTVRTQLLFAYQPSPGTAVFVGYGNAFAELAATAAAFDLHRESDAVFVKWSQQLRW